MRPSEDLGAPSAFVLGGNATTLAFVTSLRANGDPVTAYLVPLAQTPVGVVCGDVWQTAKVPVAGLLAWIDATFSADDERAFAAPARDLELLVRTGWDVSAPSRLDAAGVLNIDDVPEDIAEALASPPQRLGQCVSCRRICVWDDFVWKERHLCAWDFHRLVFGKRGPWRIGAYEADRTEVPHVAYLVPPLLEEAGAQVILGVADLDENLTARLVETVIGSAPTRAHIVVRTPDGLTLVRERE